ncbi:MAG: hypothetical protein ABUS54_02010 [Actinomycetota bacterium]
MRRLTVIGAALVLVPAASASSKPKTGFEFGRTGGSIAPFTLTVATTGAVHATGAAPDHRTRLSKEQLALLNRVAFVVDFEHLAPVTACATTLPDVAAQFIRVGNRTVRVHGGCVARFNRLWNALSAATRAG